MIRGLCEYIVASGNGFSETYEIGVNLFAGTRPSDSPDNCVVVRMPIGARVDHLMNNRRDFRVQIIFRNNDWMTGWDEANLLMEFLLQARGETFTAASGDTYWVGGCIGNLPADIGQDENGRHEFSANFTVPAQLGG